MRGYHQRPLQRPGSAAGAGRTGELGGGATGHPAAGDRLQPGAAVHHASAGVPAHHRGPQGARRGAQEGEAGAGPLHADR